MSYIVTYKKKQKKYYSIATSIRKKKSKNPSQKRKYLGRYLKAIEKINSLNFSQEEKEKFINKIKNEEENLNDDLFQDLPNKKYNCIVIDPPWFYQLRNKDLTHRNKIPYPPMKIEDILKLPIPA